MLEVYYAFGSSYNQLNDAGEFGDHRGHQALDGICQAVHEYALGQRPLFGMTVC